MHFVVGGGFSEILEYVAWMFTSQKMSFYLFLINLIKPALSVFSILNERSCQIFYTKYLEASDIFKIILDAIGILNIVFRFLWKLNNGSKIVNSQH